jgi:hypothetical protein
VATAIHFNATVVLITGASQGFGRIVTEPEGHGAGRMDVGEASMMIPWHSSQSSTKELI